MIDPSSIAAIDHFGIEQFSLTLLHTSQHNPTAHQPDLSLAVQECHKQMIYTRTYHSC